MTYLTTRQNTFFPRMSIHHFFTCLRKCHNGVMIMTSTRYSYGNCHHYAKPTENLRDDIMGSLTKDGPTTSKGLIRFSFSEWGGVTRERLHGLYPTLPRTVRVIIRCTPNKGFEFMSFKRDNLL